MYYRLNFDLFCKIYNLRDEQARSLAEVHHPNISVGSYAGFFTVNKTYNSNLFFWYVPAENNPENAPVVLWLQGGPGATSMYALFNENGPFVFDDDGVFMRNKHSWTLDHHVIYLDQPVGTGYSFTDSQDGYAMNEVDVGQNILKAMRQFFVLFCELQKNEFYAFGSSDGGKYVPAIGSAILNDSYRTTCDPMKPKINLKGLGIGNGLTDPIHQYNRSRFVYQLGLLDWRGYERFLKYEADVVDLMKQNQYLEAYNFDNILYDLGVVTGFTAWSNVLKSGPRNYYPFYDFIQSNVTRCAIHVGNHTFEDVILDIALGRDNAAYNYLIPVYQDSVVGWVCELLLHYKMLVYTGHLDVNCNYMGIVNYLNNLNCSGVEGYKKANRIPWLDGDDVAGYVKQIANLTEIMLRNAGKFNE